ncbi:MafI family immunity protein [Denitrobaculum tricleocarpae]|uniref:MafI family immunity protein n=1 Tax=Denitrobaculum tricleocarpae TaxID=2591009 RepID=A0A545TEL4_9PROT|nr:MafI family immunity protein [Denitrobaculum tricleocarpae]TQV75660.1 MafI family immunity protein [Denitrobaculum tricleocarpae]
MTYSSKICKQLSKTAFELTKSRVASADAEDIRAYLYEHNEWGLAMETLVDVLLEGDIAISSEQKAAIMDAMNAMELDRGQVALRTSD